MLFPLSLNIETKYTQNHKHRRLMYYYDSLDVEELDPLMLAFEDEDDLDNDFDDDDFDDDFDDEDWDDLDEEEWEDEDDYYEEEDDDDFY